MAFKIPALDDLIELLGRLPGLGEKSAQRIAFHILKSKTDLTSKLAQTLQQVKDQVHNCNLCFGFTDQVLCPFCADPTRPSQILCVIEEPSDILKIEDSLSFRGKYHVLQGLLSPLDGIGPDQIRVKELVDRIRKDGVTEVILALSANFEGDSTSLYLTNLIKPLGVKVTRIAQGVPIGGHLEYVDYRTLSRAIENRVEL